MMGEVPIWFKTSANHIMPSNSKKKTQNFVTISSKSYGKVLRGTRIFWEGKKTKMLRKDGSIKFGKHILELLKGTLGQTFRWILTTDTDSIVVERGIYRVRTSM